MPFLTRAVMEPYDKTKWRMVNDLDYKLINKIIRIPHGFIHDLASIPRPLNLLIRQNGPHREAAILHDWLYENGGKLENLEYTRAEADKHFYVAMRESGTPKATAWLMYQGVNWFGWVAWKNCLKRLEQEQKA